MGKIKNTGLQNIIVSGMMDGESEFLPIIADGDDRELKNIEVPDVLPILPLRNTVLFPGVVLPITVGREKSLKLIKDVYQGSRLLGTIAQKDYTIDKPKTTDLYSVGTVAEILKILEMPDGSTSVIIQGKRRYSINEFISEDPYFKAKVEALNDVLPNNDNEFDAIIGSLKDLSIKIAQFSANVPPEATFAVKNIENSTFLINFICSNTDINVLDKQNLLEIENIKDRGIQAISFLVKEVQMLELKNDIQKKVKTDMDKQQREFMLNQHMKTIQDELGGNPVEQEIKDLKEKAKTKKWTEEVAKFFEKEVEKLARLNPAAGEYSVQFTYCQTLLELPWNEYTNDNFDLKNASKVLDEDHYGLEKVKERILEHLAVLKLKNDMKSPILCLYGPPGVGKTSLGKSVARALDRNYARMSLGGLHDESEIRGHRKTYIGAMPGRIIQNIKKSKSANPVFILDEIDKVSKNFHGDPASALLEVLDPEQNSEFHDNYVEVDYDLSKVMFIATANTLSTIAPPLRDRLEMIEVSGYLVEEKIEIAKRHLIPKQIKNHGLKKGDVTFPKEVIEIIIDGYTRESGVRELDKKIAKVIRRIAKKIAFEEKYNKKLAKTDIREYLGVTEYSKEKYQGNDFAGVVTGLAWTAVGGEILYVETSLSKGKGGLTLTGNLGDVMKESAMLAHEYLKSHADELQLKPEVFSNWNVHVHVPEGAIPKDGPSAGVTMVTSLASAFTQRKVKKNMAMTGEITLRGKVLPVGGIKEKILAAKRAGITEIILSEQNKKNLEEIKEIYLKGLKFHFVKTIMDVLEIALLKTKVDNPLKIS
ncbi:MAG: endopeptidase La [Prolixibacteraceae bacterium]|jgi:ATP-dependent Lon protease|nr:endopeptidase La [Prolixibacteraceae bacterium]MBT6765366.1 endopeptidase La [Prolixibacteraceae bacterium]MBT7000027.1 endopeptidase La [Prolixibacteraceae bacterium]MBT7395503.1 endopeptidase La [Prolixibacteraceae bacterium]